MKRICIFLIINLMFILVGCTTSEYIDKSTLSEVETNALKDNTINNNEEILDLPKELYKIENSAYAQPLRYDFKVADNTNSLLPYPMNLETSSLE